MTSSKPGLFAREATGLVREIGFTLGVIIILSHVIGLGWQKRVFQFSGPMPIPNDLMPLSLPPMFWAFIVVGIFVLITGYAVGWVTSTMPRSGGGYVTISRIVHPFAGYIASWGMFLAEAFSYGLIGVAVFEGVTLFYSIALAPTVVSISPEISFVGGLIIVWIFAALALLGTKLYGRFMEALFYIPAAITVIFFVMWAVGTVNPTVTANGVQTVMGASADKIVNLALNPPAGLGVPSMAKEIPSFATAFAFALPGAFWAYMGWYATSFLAGEVKEANKKLPMVLVASGVILIIVYALATSLSATAAMGVAVTKGPNGHDWSLFQAYSYLTYVPDYSNKMVKATLTSNIPNFQPAWSTGVASIVARGMGLGWLAWLIALGAVLWVANDIPPFILVASRTFFAMAFDRMMPDSFAYVSEKWHSPVWAIIVTALFAIPGLIAESNVGGLTPYFMYAGVVGTDIFDSFFLSMTCLSAMLLPLERKEIFDRAAVRHSIGTVVTIGFFAFLAAGYCFYTFIGQSTSWLFTPSEIGDWSSFFGFFGLIIVGILLYAYYRHKNISRGVDMRTLFISIPPE